MEEGEWNSGKMGTMRHEEVIIRAFVRSDRRPRYLELIKSAKKRRRFLRALNHVIELDPRYSTRLENNMHTAQQIALLLREKGASDLCYAVSENSELDGRELPLVEALEQVVGFGMGSFLSCVPGRLAYFEGEDPGERYICERP
jgi:hypothetical protein